MTSWLKDFLVIGKHQVPVPNRAVGSRAPETLRDWDLRGDHE